MKPLAVDFTAVLDRPRRLTLDWQALADFKAKTGYEFWQTQSRGADLVRAVVTFFEILTAAAGEPMTPADIERFLTETTIIQLRAAFTPFHRQMADLASRLAAFAKLTRAFSCRDPRSN